MLILCPCSYFPALHVWLWGIFSCLFNPSGRILQVLFTSAPSDRAKPPTALPGNESDHLTLLLVFQPYSMLHVHPLLVRCVSPLLNTIFS